MAFEEEVEVMEVVVISEAICAIVNP